MIQKLRWKFVTIMMIIVAILLSAVFVTLYYSTKMNYQQQGIAALRGAIEENYPANNPPPMRRNESPILVVDEKPDGSLTVIRNSLYHPPCFCR